MRKYFFRPDRAAKPDQKVEVRKIEYLLEDQPEAKQLRKVSYKRKSKATVYKRTETEVLGQGKYIGNWKTISTFVWLDPEE